MSVMPNPDPAAPIAGRVCTRCGKFKLASEFSLAQRARKDGTRGLAARCKACTKRVYDLARAKKRPAGYRNRLAPRTDARGFVWCWNCERYLPSPRFKRHPSADRWWPYCQECCRELDSQRKRRKPGTDNYERAALSRLTRKRAQSRREDAERREFVANAMLLLRRRGLTKVEISRICQLGLKSMLKWERKQVHPDPHVPVRLGELLMLTADWAVSEKPAYRRITPHPDFERLKSAMSPVCDAHPIRTVWISRERKGGAK